MSVVWLLDFDGVINVNKPGWSAAPYHQTVRVNQEHRLRWAPQLVREILGVRDLGVDVRWCSTWILDGQTRVLERVLRVPKLDDSFADNPSKTVDELKLEAAIAVVKAGDKLIWTDDESIPTDPEQLAWFDGHLLLRPDGRSGLQPTGLEVIRAFVRANLGEP